MNLIFAGNAGKNAMSKSLGHKRIRLISLLFAVLICAAVCVLFAACNRKNLHTSDSSPCYDINMEYDAQTAALTASQEILYTAGADLNCVILHIYANAFAEDNDAIDILSAQIDRQNVDFEVYGDDRTLLKLPCSLKKGDICLMTLKYTVRLPHSDSRFGVTEQGIANLTCFYPVVARYEDGWREDCYTSFGDPFYCDTSSFYVTLTVDEELCVASSGEIAETRLHTHDGKNKKTVDIEAENIRDFGMAVGRLESLSKSVSVGGKTVRVNYCYYDDSDPSGALDRAANSLSVFSQAFGEYSHSSFTVVQSNLKTAGGMEYGGFVLVSPMLSRREYLDTITHETAHQWWYDAVGSDQLNSAWLDEGLTEFCTHYYHYLIGERSVYSEAMAGISRAYSTFSALKPTVGFDGRMNRHLTAYLTEGEYVAVTYYKGAMLFDALHSLVGDKKFQAAMKSYYSSNFQSVASQADLAAAFATQGYNISSIIANWTDDVVRM